MCDPGCCALNFRVSTQPGPHALASAAWQLFCMCVFVFCVLNACQVYNHLFAEQTGFALTAEIFIGLSWRAALWMTVIEMLLLPDSVRSFDWATGAYSTKNVHMKKQQMCMADIISRCVPKKRKRKCAASIVATWFHSLCKRKLSLKFSQDLVPLKHYVCAHKDILLLLYYWLSFRHMYYYLVKWCSQVNVVAPLLY